ncbi:MAG: DUF1127 domain-containing protein [Rhizobium sp.]|nr:DUF1127 domain-containing protein [Rhizobium sp.]
MFADISHSPRSTLIARLSLFAGRLFHAFDSMSAGELPPELARLSDHQLRDIGIDPRSIRASPPPTATEIERMRREWP